MNLRQAKALKPGDILHYTGKHKCGDPDPQTNAKKVLRWKVTGQVKTWKRDESRVLIPVKFGLYAHGKINETELNDWHREDECPLYYMPLPGEGDETQSTTDPIGLDHEPPIPFPILDPSWLESKQNEEFYGDTNEKGQRLLRTNTWPYVRTETEEEKAEREK